jgi:26S proteasome non-ATPase regulatory subunit 9
MIFQKKNVREYLSESILQMTSPPLIEKTRELIAARDAVDERLKTLQAVLIEQKSDMTESLIGILLLFSSLDDEGYPRADRDIYLIRMTRTEIISLRNDYKSLSEQIHLSMQGLHSEGRVVSAEAIVEFPFMIVESVAPDSPCDTVIFKGDRITQFGRIKKVTSGSDSKTLMEGVSQTVTSSENVW